MTKSVNQILTEKYFYGYAHSQFTGGHPSDYIAFSILHSQVESKNVRFDYTMSDGVFGGVYDDMDVEDVLRYVGLR